MLNRMQRLIAAVLVGLLGSGSAVADASDWPKCVSHFAIPLAA